MLYTIKYQPQKDYILGKITGKLTSTLLHNYIIELAWHIQQTHCLRVLNNLCEVTNIDLSISFIYDIPKLFAKHNIPLDARRAMVVPPNRNLDDETDIYSFHEKVVRSQGQNIKVFTDFQAAEDWLMEEDI